MDEAAPGMYAEEQPKIMVDLEDQQVADMWDELPPEDALEQARSILALTEAGEVDWQRSDEVGAFIAERPRAVAVLDTVVGATGREKLLRLRFSRRGEVDFSSVVQQRPSGGEPLPAEAKIDALLARLYQIVSTRLAHRPRAVEEYLDEI